MLITSIPQYIQGLTNAKLDLTTTNATVLYTAPSDADFNASIITSILVSEDSGNADTLTLNKLNTSVPFVSVKVRVSALPESLDTKIELIIDALKSAALGAVYKTVAFVVVKSNLALVSP